MTIVDLRQLSSRQIEPLLAEEAQRWREELRWDYRSSLELIKKFVEARSLAGCAALEGGEAAGYAFYVIEEHKGLLGGLYVSPRFPQLPLANKLLTSTLETLRALPYIGRIEAQLVPFGCEFDAALAKHGFRLYPRQFMLLDLNRAAANPATNTTAHLCLMPPPEMKKAAARGLRSLTAASKCFGQPPDSALIRALIKAMSVPVQWSRLNLIFFLVTSARTGRPS